jgi:hypothetical protein
VCHQPPVVAACVVVAALVTVGPVVVGPLVALPPAPPAPAVVVVVVDEPVPAVDPVTAGPVVAACDVVVLPSGVLEEHAPTTVAAMIAAIAAARNENIDLMARSCIGKFLSSRQRCSQQDAPHGIPSRPLTGSNERLGLANGRCRPSVVVSHAPGWGK